MMYTRPLIPFFFLIACLSPLWAGNYRIAPESSTLAVEVAANPPHHFTSVAQKFDCNIQISPETLEVHEASCTFQFADLDSKKSSRDKKMRKWIGTEDYPNASFKLLSVKEADSDGEQLATGEFTMHGITKTIEIPFTVHREGQKVILDGHTEFDYRDWDLEIIRLLIFTVKPTVKPYFHLEGTLSAQD